MQGARSVERARSGREFPQRSASRSFSFVRHVWQFGAAN
jgi:hypothetical protein